MKQLWERIAALSDRSLDPRQLGVLHRYRDWLIEEAVPAGGLGPGEGGRVDERHIGDSLLFSVPIPDFPEEVWDLGSGAGLPGIPLAILIPETRFILIERSQRRADLLERVVRILGLPNASVVRNDIESLEGPVPAIVSRAALGAAKTSRIADHVLESGGFAVMGGSWRRRPSHTGWETFEIPADLFDHPVWFLIMRRQ